MRLKRSSARSPVVPGDAFRSLAGRAVTLLARVEGAGRDKRSASLVVGRRAESSPWGAWSRRDRARAGLPPIGQPRLMRRGKCPTREGRACHPGVIEISEPGFDDAPIRSVTGAGLLAWLEPERPCRSQEIDGGRADPIYGWLKNRLRLP